jgi:hypothetical protein
MERRNATIKRNGSRDFGVIVTLNENNIYWEGCELDHNVANMFQF